MTPFLLSVFCVLFFLLSFSFICMHGLLSFQMPPFTPTGSLNVIYTCTCIQAVFNLTFSLTADFWFFL